MGNGGFRGIAHGTTLAVVSAETSIHVRRAKDGDVSSVAWLVRRLGPLLEAQARYRLGGRFSGECDPEDLVQEAWAIALPRLGGLDARAGRETPVLLRFLATTILNLVNNLARRALRRGTGPLDTDVRASAPGPATLAGSRDAQDSVRAAIADLPDADREILVLRGIEGLEPAAIADLLELSPNTVAQRWRRALTRLRARLPASVFDEL